MHPSIRFLVGWFTLLGQFLVLRAQSSDLELPQGRLSAIGKSWCLTQNGVPYPGYEKQPFHLEWSLNGAWLKERLPVDHDLSLVSRTVENISRLEAEGQGRHLKDYPDDAWISQRLPVMENPPPDRYQDGVWYRRKFQLPDAMKDQTLLLQFGGVNYLIDVWVNGRWVGSHEGGYTPFTMEMTQEVLWAEDNTIALRVDNIPWIPHRKIFPGDETKNKKNIVPYKTCDWWNYGGVLREMTVLALPSVAITRVDVRPVGEDSSQLEVTSWLWNTGTIDFKGELKGELFDAHVTSENILNRDALTLVPEGQNPLATLPAVPVQVKAGEVIPQIITLPTAQMKTWSPEQPHLYVVAVSLESQGGVVDRFATQTGKRSVYVEAESQTLQINGERAFLRGVARHEVFPGASGGELYKGHQGILEDMQLIKKLNVNFIRTGHNPNHSMTYLLADRLGFWIWEEIPVFWFDGPQFDLQRETRKVTTQMWLEMIYRDYNRPSILFWSSCNESTAADKDERQAFLEDLNGWATLIDGTRLHVQSSVGDDPEDSTFDACDLMSYTSYHGVFYGKDYFTDTLNDLDHKASFHTGKPLLITEFGVWSEQDLSNVPNQLEVMMDTWEAAESHAAVCGVTWWTAFDWHTMITEPASMGLVTWDRKLYKPAFYLLQRLYAAKMTDLKLTVQGPRPPPEHLSGDLQFTGALEGSASTLEVTLDLEHNIPVTLTDKTFDLELDSLTLSDGPHLLQFKTESLDGVHYWDPYPLHIENHDDPPTLTLNLQEGRPIPSFQRVLATVNDDRGVTTVTLMDTKTGVETGMDALGHHTWQAVLDASSYAQDAPISFQVIARDGDDNETVVTVNGTVDHRSDLFIELPLNHDWIAPQTDMRLAHEFYNYPAECLPTGKAPYFYFEDDQLIRFQFKGVEGEENNNMECFGQEVPVPLDSYSAMHILAVMHNATQVNHLVLQYEDDSSEEVLLPLSDWWGARNHLGEKVALFCPYHQEHGRKKVPPVALYKQFIAIDAAKKLKRIDFPIDARLHIFAVTMERPVTSVPVEKSKEQVS